MGSKIPYEELDPLVRDWVKMLNDRGICTVGSCSHHILDEKAKSCITAFVSVDERFSNKTMLDSFYKYVEKYTLRLKCEMIGLDAELKPNLEKPVEHQPNIVCVCFTDFKKYVEDFKSVKNNVANKLMLDCAIVLAFKDYIMNFDKFMKGELQ